MTAEYDFGNPVMSCALISKEGDRIPLWSKASEAPTGEGLPSLAVVQELIIEIGLGYPARMTATLVLPHTAAVAFLNHPILEYNHTRLTCQFGYTVGNRAFLSPPYVGLLLNPDIQIGVETTINLVSEGVYGFSATRQGHAAVLTGTREDIIRTLLSGPSVRNPRGVEPDFDEIRRAPDSLAFQKMFEEEITVSPGWIFDWHIVMRLVKEARCYMIYTGELLSIFPADTRFTGRPRYKFVLMSGPPGFSQSDGEEAGKIGPASGVFPVLNFSSPTNDVYLPNNIRGMVLKGVNDASGDAFNVFVSADGDDEGGQPEARTGGGGGPPEEDGDNPGGNRDTADGEDPYPADQATDVEKDRARAEAKISADGLGIPIEIESFGVPEILPGEVIRFQGLGPVWDYNYGVHKIVHRLGTGGFSTTIEARSNSAANTAKAIELAGQVGNEEHEEQGDATERQPEAG